MVSGHDVTVVDTECCLTHFRLNKLPHTIYGKSRFSILVMSGYVILI